MTRLGLRSDLSWSGLPWPDQTCVLLDRADPQVVPEVFVQICHALAVTVDTFCFRMASSPKVTEIMHEWNVINAVLHKARVGKRPWGSAPRRPVLGHFWCRPCEHDGPYQLLGFRRARAACHGRVPSGLRGPRLEWGAPLLSVSGITHCAPAQPPLAA